MNTFHASQMLDMAVPDVAISIEHYLKQPRRLVQAITDPQRIQSLSGGVYRLSLRPITFLAVRVEPTVDLKVWTDDGGTLHLQSVASQVRGIAFINHGFTLNLAGRLTPMHHPHQTQLQGQADLTVQVEVPPPLKFMPAPVIQSAGHALLSGVLLTIKHRIERHLVQDYRAWVQQVNDGDLSPALGLGPEAAQ